MGVHVNFISRFKLTRTGLPTPGIGRKEPSQSLRPRPYPDQTLNNHLQVPIIQGTGRPWPTLVIDIDVSKSTPSIRDNRQNYLNNCTGVNVYIGVSYNKTQTRATDTWYCCIATRNINAPPAPNPPPVGQNWPPFINIHETKAGPPYDK